MLENFYVYPLCIFDLAHNSALAEANTFAWLAGISLGIVTSGIIARRSRNPEGQRSPR
jgi:hypothetical protein